MVQLGRSEPRREAIAVPDERFFVRLVRNIAFLDVFLLAYFALLFFALYVGTGPGRAECARTVAFDTAILLVTIVLVRGRLLRGNAAELVYRLGIFLPVQFSYFQLKEIAPAVRPTAVDADLLAFDLSVFGYEPAIAWDKYVNPRTTEWFAFFYFSYFFILAAHVIPMLFSRGSAKRMAHFATGAFFVFCIGHLGYLVVPGYGPYHFLDGQFTNALEGGLFYRLQHATVEAGGSQKDIFPSLHTAVPTFFTIFSFMHRRDWPFRYTWPIVGFFATQIILATMFLRWHWMIDIFAGLALAISSALASRKIVDWEWKRRAERGLSPAFTRMTFGSGRPSADDDEKTC